LVWVRSRPTGCADSLNRSESGTTSTLVKAGPAHLGTPQLSPDGTVLVNTRGASDVRTLTVVTPGQTGVTSGTRLATACTTIGGAFDGDTAIAWEP
jgi:hypothetical protein